jgi:hypothetical protein
MSGRDNWRFAAIGARKHKPRAVPSLAAAPSIEGAPEAKRRRNLNRLMKQVGRQRAPSQTSRYKAPTSPIEGQRRGNDRFHHNLEIIDRSTA